MDGSGEFLNGWHRLFFDPLSPTLSPALSRRERAGEALLVNPERGVQAAVERRGKVTRVFEERTGSPLKRYLRALRVHH